MRAYSAACLAVGGALVLGPPAAWGQAYPVRPIRIVTAPVGAGNDFMARVIAQGLSASVGQQAVVDNGPAASLGELVAKSPADGYTLLAVGSVLWLTPFLQDNVGYDPVKDFAPITVTARSVNLLVVHPSLPAGTVKALIALAKAKPGQLNYATGGTGSSNHLAGELFKAMAGIDLVHIPYKGAGPALVDLISGQVQVMCTSPLPSLPHVRAGRLKGLAMTGRTRSHAAPEIPTVAESGVPGYESTLWYALLAPAGTPQPILDRLYRETVKVLAMPDVRQKLEGLGLQLVGNTPAEFLEVVKKETPMWGKVIKDAGIKMAQ
jgi:tripartite-type tricarboxylate transporter receptor subunit TctC